MASTDMNNEFKLCRKQLHSYRKNLKQCPKCASSREAARYKNNHEAAISRAKKWQKNNLDRVKGNNLRKFWPNVTGREALARYNELLTKQGGVCAVCKQPERSKTPNSGRLKSLDVDHCHKTGKVRGLLCNPCNRAEGLLKGDPKVAYQLALYLESCE